MNDVVSQHHQSKASNAIAGKTARACDSCLVKRARWFCPGDDAFLCQACDTSVHSANPLASRHKRVRLEVASSSKTRDSNPSSPTWHHGFTRKARTPRQAKRHLGALANHVVPEINSEDPFLEENEEEQLFCRVPVFDAFAEEFSSELIKGEGGVLDLNQEIGSMVMDHDLNLDDLLSNCEEDLAGFVGDVESLLGGTNGDEFSHVKVEEKEDEDEDEDEEVKAVIASHFDPSLDVDLNWEFDINDREGEEVLVEETKTRTKIEVENRMLLRLNYEAVVAAWASQGSPWADGIRPQFNLDEFMFQVACLGSEICDERGRGGDRLAGANMAGREARVSRYREKRRTRLFSKKIRYEVRKLNAEKRPRIKGRFVKRTTFSASSLPYQLIKK